jgi:hypothetical protein
MNTKKINQINTFFDKHYLRLWRHFFRLKMRVTGNVRPSSYPYISGDSFRKISDHTYDEVVKFDIELVKKGDIIFVSQELIFFYMQNVHPLVKDPYILICHNGDAPVDQKVVDLIDQKIIRFYAQDVICSHEKIICIPIGIENKYIHVNGVISVFDRLRFQIKKNNKARKNRIFFFFSISTNPEERGPAKEFFLKHSCMDTVEGMLSPRMHLKTLMKYKFVASPPGHAIESCRTWEALYMKTVPIVKDFVAMNYFRSLGLPIWIIHDWNELAEYDEEKLSKKYEELINSANWDSLHMDFWIKKIKDDQNFAKK